MHIFCIFATLAWSELGGIFTGTIHLKRYIAIRHIQTTHPLIPVDETMDAPDRRKYPRLKQSFRAELSKQGTSHSCKGTSIDLSQGGALIKLNQVEGFKVKDAAIVSFALPPEYTGQQKTIRLKGGAIITRIDQKNKAVGVEFTRNLKQFEPVELADAV